MIRRNNTYSRAIAVTPTLNQYIRQQLIRESRRSSVKFDIQESFGTASEAETKKKALDFWLKSNVSQKYTAYMQKLFPNSTNFPEPEELYVEIEQKLMADPNNQSLKMLFDKAKTFVNAKVTEMNKFCQSKSKYADWKFEFVVDEIEIAPVSQSKTDRVLGGIQNFIPKALITSVVAPVVAIALSAGIYYHKISDMQEDYPEFQQEYENNYVSPSKVYSIIYDSDGTTATVYGSSIQTYKNQNKAYKDNNGVWHIKD